MNTYQLDVQSFIDEHKVSAFQIQIVVLCFLVAVLDGFDVGVIGSLAPSIKAEWALLPVQLGRVFGAGLFGLALGALVFGPLADKVGRKSTLLIAVAGFGAASFASGYAASVAALVALRFLTGFCLGGALPNAITLASEYASSKHQFFMVTAIPCGFTIGGALGGVVASHLVIAEGGWRHVLMLGGVLPLALFPLLLLALPESARYLVSQKGAQAKVKRILARIAPDERLSRAQFAVPSKQAGGFPVTRLFGGDMRGGTLLLWATFFTGLLLYYLLISWLPTVISSNGSSLQAAVLLAAMFPLGSTVGALILGALMDRYNPYWVLTIAFAMAGVFVALIGQVYLTWWVLGIAIFGAGFCNGGSVVGVNALSAAFYPIAVRGTGVSWALGIGRAGSIVGSMAGGLLLSLHLGLHNLFVIVAVPAFIGAVSLAGMGKISKPASSVVAPSSAGIAACQEN